MRIIITTVVIAIHIVASAAIEARATSGPGCLYVVNVANWDTLNMRASPSAKSQIVDKLKPRTDGILHLEQACTPKHRPWAKRWCLIKHYNGDSVTTGYVKARFIRDSDCP